MLDIAELFAVEAAARDHRGVVAHARILPVADRQEDFAVRQIDALMAAGVGLKDRLSFVVLRRQVEQPKLAPRIRLRRKHRIRHPLHPAVLGRAAAKTKRLARREHALRRGMPLRAHVANHEVMAFGHARAAQAIDTFRRGPRAAVVDRFNPEHILVTVRARRIGFLRRDDHPHRIAGNNRTTRLRVDRLAVAGEQRRDLDAIRRTRRASDRAEQQGR